MSPPTASTPSATQFFIRSAPNVVSLTAVRRQSYPSDSQHSLPCPSGKGPERRQPYAASNNSQSVYTPQIVVNGRIEFVGSRAQEARQTIAVSVSQLQTEISLSPRNSDKRDREQFNVSVGKLAGAAASDTPEVWIAITEKGLHSPVSGGDNTVHYLRHASILPRLRQLGAADNNN